MEYESESVIRDIASCISGSDWTIYEENGSYHVSSACFEVNPAVKSYVLDRMYDFITKVNPACIIAFSEGIDQAVVSLSLAVAFKMQKPFLHFMMGDDNLLPPIVSNLADCCLVLPYLSNTHQLFEIIALIEKQGGHVKMVIALIDEDNLVESIFLGKRLMLFKIIGLDQIINRLESLICNNGNQTAITSVLEKLSNNH